MSVAVQIRVLLALYVALALAFIVTAFRWNAALARQSALIDRLNHIANSLPEPEQANAPLTRGEVLG